MTLKEYKKKRNLKKSGEPAGTIKKKKVGKKKGLAFVVQKHAASHLHYDFRLEIEGVLKSWAIPKGPSLKPEDKRLAIMVEDHPFDYLHFEGTIPKGSYGGGTVMVWDTGIYYPLNDDYEIIDEDEFLENLDGGKLTFALEGKKLLGIFKLIRMHRPNQKNQWLFMKVKDDFSSKKDITKESNSVLTGRTMNQIAKA